ncbi:MAG: hypothetical protein UY06_C0041G0014, partial [Candidatus Amesbacteria bacterium GW2011_GWA2_47_70]|uniref:TVP38/TMEM64 family membrane protein n=1 Tax=Candidatus Amesbacteria bacterium GW2011_GWC2_45_19 TaxID=1618366 RepID=A0A0G1M4F7_9BACT
MSKKEVIRKALLFLLIITSISGVFLYVQKLVGLAKIQQLVAESGVWGPVILIFLIVLTHIFAPIQGSPFVILGFALFGKWTIIYLSLATAISSFTNFWIARKFGRDLVVRLVGKGAMSKVDHIAAHEGVKVLIVMRFFQGYISDFISYAAGFTSIKFPVYYLISLIVPIPWTVIMFIFFDWLPQQQIFGWMLALGAVFFVIPPIYYYLKHRFTKKHIEHV